MSIDIIKKYEGLASIKKNEIKIATQAEINNKNTVLYPYKCLGEKWTIGHGVVVGAGNFKDGISVEKAEEMLNEKIKEIHTQLDNLLKININKNQFDAITSLVFNIGIGNFKRSTLLKVINKNPNNLKEIEKQFMRWVFIKQKESLGLKNRRRAEFKLYCKQNDMTLKEKIKDEVVSFITDFIEFIGF